MEIEDVVKTTAAAGGGVAASVWVFRWFRRIISNDQVQMREDRAKIDVFNVMQSQLNEARDRTFKAESERNDALVKMGEMQGQIQLLTYQLTTMNTELARVHEELKTYKLDLADMRIKLNAPWNLDAHAQPTR